MQVQQVGRIHTIRHPSSRFIPHPLPELRLLDKEQILVSSPPEISYRVPIWGADLEQRAGIGPICRNRGRSEKSTL